jgi:hypothetical protein
VDVEFRRLKDQLGKSEGGAQSGRIPPSTQAQERGHVATTSGHLDFTTLRNIHNTYLERLLTGLLLSNPALTSILRPIFEVCEQFVAQVERWGGDVLPALLFEGSLGGEESVGNMVKERWSVVAEINEVCFSSPFLRFPVISHILQTFHGLLEQFYEQLSLSTTHQPFSAATDASKSILHTVSMANASSFHYTLVQPKGTKGMERDGDVRRHVERLLLRLDFNGVFSNGKKRGREGVEILKEGGLA